MANARKNCKPTFLWQGLLIVLPVVVLAAVGLFSLRQDKILAQHEAAERAQVIADDLLPKIWIEITATNGSDQSKHHSFQIDQTGELVFPPPFAPIPIPKPLSVDELNAEQARLWLAAQRTEADEENLVLATQASRDFIASNPPENFAAVAHYGLGLLLAKQGNHEAAAEMFDLVVEKYSDAVGESGLPLQPLAQMKLLELAARTQNQIAPRNFISLDSFRSNVVYQPTPLTPYLLSVSVELDGGPQASAAGEKWRRLWESHEWSRELFLAARHYFHTDASLASSLLPVTAKESAAEENQGALTNRLLSSEGVSNPSVVVARIFWFSTPESWRRITGFGTASGSAAEIEDRNWLAVRYNSNPIEAPDPGRRVTLDNETAHMSTSHTPPRAMVSRPSRRRNGFALEVVEGPATPQSNNVPIMPSHWFFCRAESEVGSSLSELVKNATEVPEYFGVGIELAGKKLSAFDRDLHVWHDSYYISKGAGQVKKEHSRELASTILASSVHAEDGIEQLKVDVYLTSPSALFKRQRTRTFWFGSLIGVSALAALVGLFTAWDAFNRQQRLSEMKSNFVSSVSHELRAPIASVRLMAESLERGKVTDGQKQSEYFRFIGQECRRLSSLIENVLDFSRIEQGRKQYEFEPTNLVALVQQTVKLMENCAQEKGVRLVLETSNIEHRTSNIEHAVDGRAIQQALVNLIDNAIKHSPGGSTVMVGLESDSRHATGGSSINSQPSTLNLFVEDNGEGIPPEEHEKIFERFYRLGSELRRETQGVGIGLSIVKHIVEAHGGRVLVRSAVGQGSRFTIELPMKNETFNIQH